MDFIGIKSFFANDNVIQTELEISYNCELNYRSCLQNLFPLELDVGEPKLKAERDRERQLYEDWEVRFHGKHDGINPNVKASHFE